MYRFGQIWQVVQELRTAHPNLTNSTITVPSSGCRNWPTPLRKRDMWKDLYKRLVTDEGLELIRPPADAINSAITHVEDKFGIRLPAGYKASIHESNFPN